LEKLMENRTVFVIAHRLSTIRNANRIIVLSEGRRVEEGTHDELITLSGEYRRLYNLQFKDEGLRMDRAEKTKEIY
jgi:ABC-type multidrug transport system fused ATPase/permease subunit